MMNRAFFNICLLVCMGFISSCEKDELPVKLPAKSDNVQLGTADMTENYDRQVFVNLETGQQWTADNDDWDLQLEAHKNGCLIRLNGGKGVLVAATGKNKFERVTTEPLNWRWDGASGLHDSLALAGCYNPSVKTETDSVYVIDRGFAVDATERYYQFYVKEISEIRYVIVTAQLDGSSVQEHTVYKDSEKLNVYFSFAQGGKCVPIEPDYSQWHFCFTRYRWIYYEFSPPLLYTVVGVHINTAAISVGVDSTQKFETLTPEFAQMLHYSNRRDAIGFEWKYPDFTSTGVRYITRNYINFVVHEHNAQQAIYKMRFIDFYNDQGIKGTPRFEYLRIK
jgi:hypothetical protein